MPQLNPAPWFAILVFSWLVFLFLVMPKTLDHTFPNEPAAQTMKDLVLDPWPWQW
uniref:ATP synthase complex subunit 8 n=1 Tax=Pandaka pygmaea TaxID=1480109 RepID=A0A1S5QIV9_9GOBI|nr:ATP synthase F0 subunit 8 [Pandaka pygmaea]